MENKTMVWSLVALAAVLVLVNWVGFSSINVPDVNVDENAIAQAAAALVIQNMPAVPTAEEVASKIVVPEVTIPEINVPEFKSDSHVQDLWEDMYAEEIDELEMHAYDVALEEVENRDYRDLEDWFEENVEDFDEFDRVSERDSEVEIMQLGVNDDDDKDATVYFKFKVVYTLNEGVDDDYKKYLYATADVSFEDGDFDDEEVFVVYSVEEPAILA